MDYPGVPNVVTRVLHRKKKAEESQRKSRGNASRVREMLFLALKMERDHKPRMQMASRRHRK